MVPLTAKKSIIAETGHMSPLVVPTYKSMPILVWSVFEFLILIYITVGCARSSTAMSSGVKCHAGLNALFEATVISPDH